MCKPGAAAGQNGESVDRAVTKAFTNNFTLLVLPSILAETV